MLDRCPEQAVHRKDYHSYSLVVVVVVDSVGEETVSSALAKYVGVWDGRAQGFSGSAVGMTVAACCKTRKVSKRKYRTASSIQTLICSLTFRKPRWIQAGTSIQAPIFRINLK